MSDQQFPEKAGYIFNYFFKYNLEGKLEKTRNNP